MKRMMLIGLMLLLVLVLAIPSSAATTVVKAGVSLSFSGTSASCSGWVSEASNYIDATLELWDSNNVVASWSMDGMSYVSASGSASVVHGESYTLMIVGTSGGVSFTPASITKICP